MRHLECMLLSLSHLFRNIPRTALASGTALWSVLGNPLIPASLTDAFVHWNLFYLQQPFRLLLLWEPSYKRFCISHQSGKSPCLSFDIFLALSRSRSAQSVMINVQKNVMVSSKMKPPEFIGTPGVVVVTIVFVTVLPDTVEIVAMLCGGNTKK